jgi:hypothetical protein
MVFPIITIGRPKQVTLPLNKELNHDKYRETLTVRVYHQARALRSKQQVPQAAKCWPSHVWYNNY